MFGQQSFADIPKIRDMQSHFEDPRYATWNDFRGTEDARYVGLCVPRFLVRAPYGSRESELSVKDFNFSEDVIDQHDRYVWVPASLALTANIASSFAKYRWCPNIIGPQAGGAVDGLPLHQYEQDGELKTVNPCEAPIEMRKEYEFSQQGFIPLVHKQGSTRGVFFSANSAQRPKVFPKTPEGLAAQRNFMLGTRLPYMFVVTRLSHYIKAIVTEKIGKNMEAADLQRELSDWLRQYVTDMDNPHPDIRAQRPLRQAKVIVEEVPGQVGWYRCDLKLRPHFKFEGASFELSLVGKIDKS
jgi:type VI secretion system protein ImpC